MLDRRLHLRRGDGAEAGEGRDEAGIAGHEAGAQARQARPFGQRLERDHIGQRAVGGERGLERAGPV